MEDVMRAMICSSLACFLIAGAAVAAQPELRPSEPQAYCVGRDGDFYPYAGGTCKSGYQLGSGNCRQDDGRVTATPKSQCLAMNGHIELPVESPIGPRTPAKPAHPDVN